MTSRKPQYTNSRPTDGGYWAYLGCTPSRPGWTNPAATPARPGPDSAARSPSQASPWSCWPSAPTPASQACAPTAASTPVARVSAEAKPTPPRSNPPSATPPSSSGSGPHPNPQRRPRRRLPPLVPRVHPLPSGARGAGDRRVAPHGFSRSPCRGPCGSVFDVSADINRQVTHRQRHWVVPGPRAAQHMVRSPLSIFFVRKGSSKYYRAGSVQKR